MTYADAAEVESLAGKSVIKDPSSGSDITAQVIVDAIERGDSRVKLETGVDTWSTSDAIYGSVKQASEYFAAAYILQRYADSDGDNKQAMTYYQMALDICSSISTSSTASVIIQSKPYKSFPISSTGTIHSSLFQTGEDTLTG